MKIPEVKWKHIYIAAAILTAMYYGVFFYLACLFIIYNVLLFPLRLGEKNNKDIYEMSRIRIASLGFGWAILPYFWAIYIATIKHEF